MIKRCCHCPKSIGNYFRNLKSKDKNGRQRPLFLQRNLDKRRFPKRTRRAPRDFYNRVCPKKQRARLKPVFRFIARETIDEYCAPGRFICLKTRETLRLVNLSATQNNARAALSGRALRPPRPIFRLYIKFFYRRHGPFGYGFNVFKTDRAAEVRKTGEMFSDFTIRAARVPEAFFSLRGSPDEKLVLFKFITLRQPKHIKRLP